MTGKRFTVHNIIKGFDIGHSCDLDTLYELLNEYGASENIQTEIRDNNKCMTYAEVVNQLNNFNNENIKLEEENKELKEKLEYGFWIQTYVAVNL